MTEDVAFYVELAHDADGPIVELGVGTGRVAIPVARETERPIVGIDSSPAMLEVGAPGRRQARVDLELREGDMSRLSLDEPAALIYCPFRALLHLSTWQTAAGRSSGSLPRCGRADASPGTRSSSARTSPPGTTASRSHMLQAPRSGSTSSTRRATTAST